MMWLDTIAKIDHLKIWVKHCPVQKFVIAPDGTIVWANVAFLVWAKYSQYELGRLKLDDICVMDDAARKDIEDARQLSDKWEPVVRVNRQIVPKNERPCWGEITFIRYPVEGNVDYCFCTWDPLRNGTAAAFALAVERTSALENKVDAVLKVIKKDETVERRLWNTIGEWIEKNPKMAIVVTLIFLALNPYPIITTWVTRMGWMPAQPVQIEVKDPDTGETKPASQNLINKINGVEDDGYAHSIVDVAPIKSVTFTTPDGSKIETVAEYKDGRWRRTDISVPRIGGGIYGGDNGFRRRSLEGGGHRVGVDDLSNAAVDY